VDNTPLPQSEPPQEGGTNYFRRSTGPPNIFFCTAQSVHGPQACAHGVRMPPPGGGSVIILNASNHGLAPVAT
jgi:hypothetical protein